MPFTGQCKSCSHFRIESCGGICRNTEKVSDYNTKVGAAIQHIGTKKENFIIKEKGRHIDEEAFVIVRNDVYSGYGFIERETQIRSYNDLEAFTNPRKNTVETEGIIRSYLTRNPEKMQRLNKAEIVLENET